jgi:predicted GIY-YIG superfamily endonuclease
MRKKITDNISCVYMIRSISCPDKIYVGGTGNYHQRKLNHLRDLRAFKHGSILLQEHFNEYGASDLVFSIIEKCDVSELHQREQYWLIELNPFFNTQLMVRHPDRKVCKINDVDGCQGIGLIWIQNSILEMSSSEEIIDIDLLTDYI